MSTVMQTAIVTPESTVDIAVSSYFLGRLQNVLLWIIANQSAEDVKSTNEKILQGTPFQEEWQDHYLTMLSLVAEIEAAAGAQEKTQLVALDVPQT